MEYYSAIKRNDSGSLELRWTNLEPVIQRKTERENKISYINIYTESRKMVLMNLFSRQE